LTKKRDSQFKFEKRQKELARKKKKEEKKQRHQEINNEAHTDEAGEEQS
jgi:hypothetical protein